MQRAQIDVLMHFWSGDGTSLLFLCMESYKKIYQQAYISQYKLLAIVYASILATKTEHHLNIFHHVVMLCTCMIVPEIACDQQCDFLVHCIVLTMHQLLNVLTSLLHVLSHTNSHTATHDCYPHSHTIPTQEMRPQLS